MFGGKEKSVQFNAKAFLKQTRPRAGDQVKITGSWKSPDQREFIGKNLKVIKTCSDSGGMDPIQDPNLQIKVIKKNWFVSKTKGLCKFYTSTRRCFKGSNCAYRHTSDPKERKVNNLPSHDFPEPIVSIHHTLPRPCSKHVIDPDPNMP